ncbi:MAG: glycosyltransferase, partial [bacterium]
RLAGRGHEVWLVSVQMWDGAPEFIREGVHCVGVCRWKPNLSVGGKRSFWQPLYFARHLISYLRRNDFDLIDCSNFPYLSCLAARTAVLFRRTRLVITWYEARGLRRWMEHRGPATGVVAGLFELWIARLTASNAAISAFTAEHAQKFLGLNHMAVVPCGVDIAAIAAAPENPAKKDQILYVGRLTRYKRVDMLIEAFSHIASRFPEQKLRIVGKGYERERLQILATKLGLVERVIFCEGLSEKELQIEYAKSCMFVLPSEQEGFGMVLLEAMAAGTPVIALKAPHSAACSLVSHGNNGILVANTEELTDALGSLLGDDDLRSRLAVAGRETARMYDWDEAVIPTVEKYYRDVVGG